MTQILHEMFDPYDPAKIFNKIGDKIENAFEHLSTRSYRFFLKTENISNLEVMGSSRLGPDRNSGGI